MSGSTQQQQQRKGTRQESTESRAKRGANATHAQSRTAIYGNPLPLYVSNNDASLALLYSLTWTLSLSCQAIAATLIKSKKKKQNTRNRIHKEAYLPEKIQGVWDERTKSVWVLPTTSRASTTASTSRRRRTTKSQTNSQTIEDSLKSPAADNQNDDDDDDEDAQKPWMEWLWKRGFFGKGSLSRSEPTWWQREKNRVTGEHVPTAEDITSARRAERKIVKKQKAQERADEKEKQALALAESRQGLPTNVSSSAQEEGGSTPIVPPASSAPTAIETETATQVLREATEDALLEVKDPMDVSTVIEQTEKILASDEKLTQDQKGAEELESAPLQSTNTTKPTSSSTRPKAKVPNATLAAAKQEAKMASMEVQVPNLEHTQLQREEAFFLVFCTGALEVVLPTLSALPTTSGSLASLTGKEESSSAMVAAERSAAQPQSIDLLALWDLFLRSSLTSSFKMSSLEAASAHIRPDNPFIVSYAVYHHYRSLGWVVRNGVKFCADWVLYKGADGVKDMRGGAGPVGGHAEFAIAIIPTYEDPSDAMSSAQLKFRRDWRWLNTINRVNSGVKKTVILTFVTIPRLSDQKFDSTGQLQEWKTPACLKYYIIKEVSLKRFIPTRMRD